ncbi:MAG: hypothetical protein LBV04_05145 [Deferribacteraceae bacterium]|jgi:pentatricopeptide repeat protein|nr:hypothetical protein [Deferribacteraceae bacterium]
MADILSQGEIDAILSSVHWDDGIALGFAEYDSLPDNSPELCIIKAKTAANLTLTPHIMEEANLALRHKIYDNMPDHNDELSLIKASAALNLIISYHLNARNPHPALVAAQELYDSIPHNISAYNYNSINGAQIRKLATRCLLNFYISCGLQADTLMSACKHHDGSDIYITTAFILAYYDIGDFVSAQELYKSIADEDKAEAALKMIIECCNVNKLLPARDIYNNMPDDNKLIQEARAKLIAAYCFTDDLPFARELYMSMLDSSDDHMQIENATYDLAEAYGRAGDLVMAHALCDSMADGYNAQMAYIKLMRDYAKAGDLASAYKLYDGMENEAKTYATDCLISYYVDTGDLATAFKLYESLADDDVNYTKAINTLKIIEAYCRAGDRESAMKLYNSMPDDNDWKQHAAMVLDQEVE